VLTIAQKTERKMAALEHLMNTQMHIKLPLSVIEALDGLSVCWDHLSEDDRDYMQLASDALSTKTEWKV
jgi:hypothetical protein